MEVEIRTTKRDSHTVVQAWPDACYITTVVGDFENEDHRMCVEEHVRQMLHREIFREALADLNELLGPIRYDVIRTSPAPYSADAPILRLFEKLQSMKSELEGLIRDMLCNSSVQTGQPYLCERAEAAVSRTKSQSLASIKAQSLREAADSVEKTRVSRFPVGDVTEVVAHFLRWEADRLEQEAKGDE